MRTERQHENIVRLSDIRQDRSRALSPYGPVRAGLTTSQRIDKDRALTELLNSLEKIVQDLNYKSFEVYDTLNTAIEAIRVALSGTVTGKGGTEVICNNCGNDTAAEGESKCLDCLEDML